MCEMSEQRMNEWFNKNKGLAFKSYSTKNE